jgi:CheY-like chemotaxis protein
MDSIEQRRVFLLATVTPGRAKLFTDQIQKHISNSTFFVAEDGPAALFKAENYPPHVVIIDTELPKLSGNDAVSALLENDKFEHTAVIIVSQIPDREQFVDDVVTGRVQFLTDPDSESQLIQCLTRALNFVAKDGKKEYQLHFLAAEEVLFNQGETAESVYLVKRGELEASVKSGDQLKILGRISAGEFVGEMAHINGEPRSATVHALTDCELIEIPSGKLDLVLFTKPGWSKALMQTLSRRLKKTNDHLVKT